MSVILEGREEQEAYHMLLACFLYQWIHLPFAAEICTDSSHSCILYSEGQEAVASSHFRVPQNDLMEEFGFIWFQIDLMEEFGFCTWRTTS